METFVHSLCLISAALVFVLPSVHMAAATNIVTTLQPLKQSVPVGGLIQLNCSAGNLPADCDYKSFLYKVEQDEARPEEASSSHHHTCSCREDDHGITRCSSSTVFVMLATLQATGLYGCVALPPDEEFTSPVSRQFIEATVTVCQEPALSVHQTRSENYTIVSVEEECNFPGELRWRIDGRIVPLPSAPLAQSADLPLHADAVHGDNNQLEIRRSDRWDATTPCDVTAEFTHISGRHLKVVSVSQDVSDCSAALQSTVLPTRMFQTQQPTNIFKTERPNQPEATWQEKWQLKKEVLELKKRVLPFQIRFFERWSRVNPKKLTQVIAEAAMDD